MKVLTVKCRGYFGVLKSLDHISYGCYDIVLQNVETNADIELHAVTLGEMDTEKTWLSFIEKYRQKSQIKILHYIRESEKHSGGNFDVIFVSGEYEEEKEFLWK